MDVYVESNFVIELALLQEQFESCERVLELCDAGTIRLVVPAYSLVEPYETLVRYAKSRRRLSSDLTAEVNQLSRSKPYKEAVEDLQKVTSLLVRSEQEENERLRDTLVRLLSVAKVIPLRSETLSSAMIYQHDHDLTPQDAIVYASVVEELKASKALGSCFLNRNSKDFDDQDIVDNLSSYGCKILFRFDDGYSYIKSQTNV
jgi:predicted nucleic acid-binding protein